MDALDLDFEAGSFDASFSVLGVFFFGDGVPVALSEMRTVVRPGGTVAAVHWADPMGGPMFTRLARAVQRLGDPTLQPIGPWGFPFLNAAELEEAFKSNRLEHVVTESLSFDGPLPSPEEMLTQMHTMYLNHPGYAQVHSKNRDALEEALAAETRKMNQGGAERLLSRAHLVRGQVPL